MPPDREDFSAKFALEHGQLIEAVATLKTVAERSERERERLFQLVTELGLKIAGLEHELGQIQQADKRETDDERESRRRGMQRSTTILATAIGTILGALAQNWTGFLTHLKDWIGGK